ncbi:MAG: helix-turn-helix domain-containing protein [Azospirillum sp.]|nr:helix-turn-helix domain-containing protein [Azospirillum sp.]
MSSLHPVQVKAARAMLDWTREELAAVTGLAVNTIRNLEAGIVPRSSTSAIIRQAIENAGLEFTDGEGVRRRNDDVRIHRGMDGRDAFFDDVVQTVRQKGGGIAVVARSWDLLVQACGLLPDDDIGTLAALSGIAAVKCLVAETPKLFRGAPDGFELRTTLGRNVGPLPCFVYGGKSALALAGPGTSPHYVVFSQPDCGRAHHEHFRALWDDALPLTVLVAAAQSRKRAAG